MSENGKRYRTLYGSTANAERIVGYCRLHKVHLTEEQMRRKQCIPKGCGAFKKWDCPYWNHRERMKEVRRMKKNAGIPSWQKVEIRTDRHGKLLTKKIKKKKY